MSPNYQKKPSTAFHFIHAGCLSWKLWNACRFFQIMNNRKRKSIRKINHKKKKQRHIWIFFFQSVKLFVAWWRYNDFDVYACALICRWPLLCWTRVSVCYFNSHISPFLVFLHFCTRVYGCVQAFLRSCLHAGIIIVVVHPIKGQRATQSR